MKKLLLFAFFVITLFGNAQEKILLTNGDSRMGVISEISDQYGNIDSYHL